MGEAMPTKKPIEVVGKMVDMLQSYPSEEIDRMISATRTLLGQRPYTTNESNSSPLLQRAQEGREFPAKALVWMKQNEITVEQIDQIFHFSGAEVEVIAPSMPGKNKKAMTYNAYVLEGIAQLLATGEAHFTDKGARALCERAGCFDPANHAKHINDKGNEFTGSKEKGWTLTSPGLKRGAALVKELSQ
jgi:hypothetical protein